MVMKRLLTSLFVAGLLGVVLSPPAADAGILSRLFGRGLRVMPPTVTAPAAPESVESGRRYSYEPAMTERSGSTVLRGQSHLLPKTDPRRYIPY